MEPKPSPLDALRAADDAPLWKTLDPRALGAMHLAVIAVGLLASAAYAMAAQSLAGRDPALSLAMVRAHGVVAVFLALLPAIPSTLGNLALPALLGRRDLAMPRVGRAALRLHGLGLALLLVALQQGATGASWTLLDAYSATHVGDSVLWLLASLVSLALACGAVALNLVVTVHASRGPDRPWRALPPLAWGLYASSLVTLVVTPFAVLLGLLVAAERTVGLGLFDPALGGDPLLHAHAVWFFLHPALGAALVASLGVAAQLLFDSAGVARRPALGDALVGLALVGLFGWGQHLYHVARSDLAVLEVAAAAVLPQLFLLWILRWLFVAIRAGLRLDVPTGYALAFVAHLAVVAPTSLALALPATGVAFGGTTFATGNLHYLAVGGVLFALLGALHRAWTELTGIPYDTRRAVTALGVLFVGVNASFFGMLRQGARGLARPAVPMGHGADAWRAVSALGGAVTLLGIVLVGTVFAAALLRAARPSEPNAAA